jgi:short subunit dehydrogenase-like uncharacterized protein
MATPRCLLYGATGYTGRLLARAAAARGLEVVLAGRNEERLASLARSLGLEHRALGLDSPARLAAALADVTAVLNAAGPFTATAGPLVDACLDAGIHYLDLTGEIEVFRAIRARDDDAHARGVMLLPGAGFIVAPSDCLARRVCARLQQPEALSIGVSRAARLSRGSMRTMIEMIAAGVLVRREGRMILTSSRVPPKSFDFGQGPTSCLAVNWADVYTAHFSTGVPDITGYLEVTPWEKGLFLASRYGAWWLQTPPWQALLKAQSGFLPEGPTDEERACQRRVIVAEAEDANGRRHAARLETPESYDFTVTVALAIVERVFAGEVKPGFQTPALAYGADFVLGFDGVTYTEHTPVYSS